MKRYVTEFANDIIEKATNAKCNKAISEVHNVVLECKLGIITEYEAVSALANVIIEEKSTKTIDEEAMTITYDDCTSLKRVVYGSHEGLNDTTIIFEDIVNKDTEVVISTAVKGFYYGAPDIELIEQYYGDLIAEFN